MQKLLSGYKSFRRSVLPRNKERFQRLALNQTPDLMFVLCSDSRLCLRRITGVDLGDVFTARNPGNIVPPYGTAHGGERAAIEFGIKVLKVQHLVVLGHSDCGAMKAMLGGTEKIEDTLPAVAAMLRSSGTNPADLCACGDKLLDLTHLHISKQLDNLMSYPFVKESVEQGTLQLHGWYYNIGEGEITKFDAASNCFVPLLD